MSILFSLTQRRAGTAATAITAAVLLALAAPSLRAQASVNETRDPNQRQDPDFVTFYKSWTHHGSPLVDHLPVVSGVPTPKTVLRLLRRRTGEAHVLRQDRRVLPRAREGDAARQGRDDRTVGRRARARRRVGVVRREHQASRPEPREPRQARRSARALGFTGPRADRDDEAELPLPRLPALAARPDRAKC